MRTVACTHAYSCGSIWGPFNGRGNLIDRFLRAVLQKKNKKEYPLLS